MDSLVAPPSSLTVIEDLIFPSPPLRSTYEQIRVPIVLRSTGCWFSGSSGQGKSTAISYCAEALRLEFPSMPVLALNVHMLPANATRSIPVRLLQSIDHKKTSGDITQLKVRLAHTLAERALKSPLRQAVLLFDEAQALRIQDLFSLKDLSNDLVRHGAGLLTVMFGESPKMEALAEKTNAGDDSGLGERFFVRQLDLCTYDSLEDWQSLFKQMDECRFSSLSNQTVPEAFLMGASGNPLRLYSEAPYLWKALKAIKTPLSLRRIFTGIRWWILHAGNHVSKAERVPADLWNRAIAFGACLE